MTASRWSQLKAHNAVIANGLAWSPDAATMYWSDTAHHVIHAWDWDAHGQRDAAPPRVPAVPRQAAPAGSRASPATAGGPTARR